uniref:NADH-ubiquinone oxidoreductase chain 2 n=1 Tax=Ledropsis sp. 1 XYW-2023a TaxID=3078463 RepID=A0AB38ZHC5_9HEMI
MLLNSSKVLFLSFMTVGVMISVSCNGWVMIWAGMELFLVSFIPFFCNFSVVSSECSMSYFLVQGLSSSLLIFSLVFFSVNTNGLISSFFCFSLLLKLGCAPFHNWVMGVITGMDYDSLLLFLTFSKLPPFFMLSYISYNLSIFVFFCLVVGSVGGLNHSSLKKILGFSSVFNMGFVVYLLEVGSLWLVYFFIYFLMVSFLVLFLILYNFIYVNSLFLVGLSFFSKLSFWFIFLSMGGMPPMVGFLIKLVCIEFSILNNDYLISMFMVIFSLVVMFYYIRCSFVSLFCYSFIIKWNVYVFYVLLNFFSFLSLLMFPLFLVLSVLV